MSLSSVTKNARRARAAFARPDPGFGSLPRFTQLTALFDERAAIAKQRREAELLLAELALQDDYLDRRIAALTLTRIS